MQAFHNVLRKSIQHSTWTAFPPTPLRPLLVRMMSTAKPQQLSPDIKPYDESPLLTTVVRIKDDDDGNGDGDGESFICDEEPHMLTPEQGYGYYPLMLGQQLQEGKLEIVRKLGWTNYSSFWLAQTLKDTYPVKYVAVKIYTVNGTAGILNGQRGEVDRLRTIKAANPNHPGYKHCSLLYDKFVAKSRHGPHICLVTNVLGMNLVQLRSAGLQPFPLALSKRIIKQTLLALDYLHRECGLVHSDVKPYNTLVCLERPDETLADLLKTEPSETYEPRIEPDLSPDPIITVKSQPLFNLDPESYPTNFNICLVGYSNATPIEKLKHSLEGAHPVLLCAPEVTLGHPWSTPIDIWSVGCLTFEYLTGRAFFNIHESATVSLDDVHLQRIIEHIGPFPSSFLQKCQRRSEFFDDQGSLLRVKKLVPQTIEQCLSIYKVMNEKDVPAAANFIRRCLTIDPSERPTALELLDDEWLKDV